MTLLSPVEVIKQLLDVNRPAALILLAGLGVLAAASIASSWSVDVPTAGLIGLYVVALGAVLYVIVSIVNDPLIKRVLGWFTTVFLIVVICTFFISAAVPGKTSIAPTPCLVRFWDHCIKVGDAVAERNFTPSTPVRSMVPPPTAPVRRSEYQVFVQFAGVIRREDVRAMMRKLREAGWGVEGVEGGGERTQKAIGFNEIRYATPQSESAARELARTIQEFNLTSSPILVKRAPGVSGMALEAWISRT
jgi:hypothetical protein